MLKNNNKKSDSIDGYYFSSDPSKDFVIDDGKPYADDALSKLNKRKVFLAKRDNFYQNYPMLKDKIENSINLYSNINNPFKLSSNLPFSDNFFDAVYHFGGINLFSSIEKGIKEMDRVVKTGGRIVFGDEGIAPWLKDRKSSVSTDESHKKISINPVLNKLLLAMCRFENKISKWLPNIAGGSLLLVAVKK